MRKDELLVEQWKMAQRSEQWRMAPLEQLKSSTALQQWKWQELEAEVQRKRIVRWVSQRKTRQQTALQKRKSRLHYQTTPHLQTERLHQRRKTPLEKTLWKRLH